MPRARTASLGSFPQSQIASFKIASTKGPGADEPQAVGNARAEMAAREIKGDLLMRNTTSRRRGQTFVPQTNGRPVSASSVPVMAPSMTEEEAARKFSALVLPYSRGDLATASDRTKEAAKHWKAGTRAPNSSSLITLARRIPRIRDWVIDQIDVPEAAQADGPDTLATVMVGLHLAANMPGQQGAMARALLKQMTGGR